MMIIMNTVLNMTTRPQPIYLGCDKTMHMAVIMMRRRMTMMMTMMIVTKILTVMIINDDFVDDDEGMIMIFMNAFTIAYHVIPNHIFPTKT